MFLILLNIFYAKLNETMSCIKMFRKINTPQEKERDLGAPRGRDNDRLSSVWRLSDVQMERNIPCTQEQNL